MQTNDVVNKQNGTLTEQLQERVKQIKRGGAAKYHEKTRRKESCLSATA